MIEEWVDIVDYEGYYQISNYGNIKSLSRKVLRGTYFLTIPEKKIKSFINNRGYKVVTLHKNKITKSFLIHRLVAQAFIDNPLNYPYVNHKDENPLNNNSTNLEWCTQKYNVNYGNAQAKLTSSKLEANKGYSIAQYSIEGNLINTYKSASQVERELGFKTSPILHCCRGGYYKNGKWQSVLQSYGYIWKFN